MIDRPRGPFCPTVIGSSADCVTPEDPCWENLGAVCWRPANRAEAVLVAEAVALVRHARRGD